MSEIQVLSHIARYQKLPEDAPAKTVDQLTGRVEHMGDGRYQLTSMGWLSLELMAKQAWKEAQAYD